MVSNFKPLSPVKSLDFVGARDVVILIKSIASEIFVSIVSKMQCSYLFSGEKYSARASITLLLLFY